MGETSSIVVPMEVISPCKLVSWHSVYVYISVGLETVSLLLRDLFPPTCVAFLSVFKHVRILSGMWSMSFQLLWWTRPPFSTLCIMEIRIYTIQSSSCLFFGIIWKKSFLHMNVILIKPFRGYIWNTFYEHASICYKNSKLFSVIFSLYNWRSVWDIWVHVVCRKLKKNMASASNNSFDLQLSHEVVLEKVLFIS